MRIWLPDHVNLAQLTAAGAESMAGHLDIEIVDIGGDWVKARMFIAQNAIY